MRGRSRLLARIDEGGRVRSWRPWAVALATTLIAVVVWFVWPGPVVEYQVAGAAVADGGFVQASLAESARITFDDGTVLDLEPAGRVRVSQRRARGANIHVEKGRVDVAVTPRDGGADYVFEAGPYTVVVVGTAFVLGWDPEQGVAVLSMKEGEVTVLGPRLERGLTLRAGQRIELRPDEVRVSDGEAPLTSASASTLLDLPSAALDDAAPATAGSARALTPQPNLRALSWAERVAAGDYDAVLADVDMRGESAVLASASVGDLMMLADAARYGSRPALANSALRAVRSRFGGTKSAASAAFFLGRTAEDAGRAPEAISLYEAAMSEGSPFASEALGRTMTLEQGRNKSRAKELAQRYLASHPKGAYANVARSILGAQGAGASGGMPKEI